MNKGWTMGILNLAALSRRLNSTHELLRVAEEQAAQPVTRLVDADAATSPRPASRYLRS